MSGILRRGGATGEEVRAQIDDQVGLSHIENRQRVHAKDRLGASPQGLAPKGLVDQTPGAGGCGECLDDPIDTGAHRATQDPGPALRGGQSGGEQFRRLIPMGGLEGTIARPLQAFANAIRNVGAPQAGLTP